MDIQPVKVSFCDKLKQFFVSSSCCNDVHNETIVQVMPDIGESHKHHKHHKKRHNSSHTDIVG